MQENEVRNYLEVVKMLEKFPYYVKPSDYLNFADCFRERLKYLAYPTDTSFYQEAIDKYYCLNNVKEVSESDARKANELVHKMLNCIMHLCCKTKKFRFPMYCVTCEAEIIDYDLPYACDEIVYIINDGFELVPKKDHKKYKVEVIKFNYLLRKNSDKNLITKEAIRLSNKYFNLELAANAFQREIDSHKKEMEELINEITAMSDYQQIIC